MCLAVGEMSRCCPLIHLYVCCSIIDLFCLENWPAIVSASATDLHILTTLLSSPAFWSTLHPASAPPSPNSANQQLCPFTIASFGQGQPQVRQAAWALVGSSVGVFRGLFLSPRCRVCGKSTLCISYSSCTFLPAVPERGVHLVSVTRVTFKLVVHIRSSTQITDVFWNQVNYQNP